MLVDSSSLHSAGEYSVRKASVISAWGKFVGVVPTGPGLTPPPRRHRQGCDGYLGLDTEPSLQYGRALIRDHRPSY